MKSAFITFLGEVRKGLLISWTYRANTFVSLFTIGFVFLGIAFMMGGPASYTNEHLERVHAHLGITEDAFIESMALMRETLEDFNFVDEDIRSVENEMMDRKNYIVARR